MRKTWLTGLAGLALCVNVATAQPEALLPASTTIPAGQWLEWQVVRWYPARAAEYTQATSQLQQTLDAHCQGESVVPSRQAWRDVLGAWNRLAAVSAGPLQSGGFHPPVEAVPAQAVAIEAAIAASGRGPVDVQGLTPEARGLAALEWLLWSPPVAGARAAPPEPAARAAAAAAPSGKVSRKAPAPRKSEAKPAARSGSKVPPTRKAAAMPLRQNLAQALAALAGLWQGGRQVLSGTWAWLSRPGHAWHDAASHFTPRLAPKAAPKAAPKSSAKPGNRKRAATPSRKRPDLPSGVPLRASRTADPAACRVAQALAGDLLTQARQLQARFDPAQALPQEAGLPAPQVLGRWQAALRQLQVQTQALADAEPVGKARLRPNATWVLSGAGPTERVARWGTLRDLAIGEAPPQALSPLAPPAEAGADIHHLEAWLRGRGQATTAERLQLTVRAVDRAMQAAALDTAVELQQAARALGVLNLLVDTEVAPALGLAPGPVVAPATPVGTTAGTVVPAGSPASASPAN